MISSGDGDTVMPQGCTVARPVLSRTRTFSGNVPAAVGVPVINPKLLMVKPGGMFETAENR